MKIGLYNRKLIVPGKKMSINDSGADKRTKVNRDYGESKA